MKFFHRILALVLAVLTVLALASCNAESDADGEKQNDKTDKVAALNATDAIKAVSSIMPQKIFNDAARMLLAGDNSGYAVVLYTSVAYLLVTICVGSVGIKMQEQEQ